MADLVSINEPWATAITPPATTASPKQQPDPDPAERARLIREKAPDYIERTKPEDPSDRPGQQTRDNVTPAIPSVNYWTGHVWSPARDICLRCGRSAVDVVDNRLECR
jgi:hypothetical protein